MDRVGVVVAVAVLVVGVAAGLWRRRTDGRLKATKTAGRPAATPRRLGPAVQMAADGDEARAVRSSAGGPADGRPAAMSDAAVDDGRLDAGLLAKLGVGPAEATLLQFSSAFCAPCRALRRLSAEVADMLPGVQHVEVDAESHLDEVRALRIWRTPTLLVLDGDGRVTRRATGVPTKPQLIAALGEVLPAAS
jgi:thiol-disulfide isomerase/thioredoxin